MLNVQTMSPSAKERLELITFFSYFRMEQTAAKRTLPTLVTGVGPETKKSRTDVEEGEYSGDSLSEYSMTSYAANGQQSESEYSVTSSVVAEYIPSPLIEVEKIIEKELQSRMNKPVPIFPPTPSPEPLEQFDFSKVMQEIQKPTKFLSEALPIQQGYEGAKVTKIKELPTQFKPIADHNIATELIYKKCAYWEQYRRLLRHVEKEKNVKEVSLYDGVNVMAYKDKKGRMYATRLYKTVEILSDVRSTNNESIFKARTIWTVPEEVNPKRIPTACIPPDSPYYAKLLHGLTFPDEGHRWYHRKAEDQVWVHIRAYARRYIHVHRNGVTAELFITGRKTQSTNVRKQVELKESQSSMAGIEKK